MAKDNFGEMKSSLLNLTKYQLAGVGFFVLNILYILIAMWKLPPVDPMMNKVVYAGLFFFIFLVLIFTPLIFRGKKLLVQVLAVIYGGRSFYSLYLLVSGSVFPAVPYFLPCLILTFYLLGRAAWDWP